MERQKPRLAATVILLRPAQVGFEVFLTRRPEGMAFLGGMYCFPGGTVRKEDCSPAMQRRCYGLTHAHARKIAGAHFTPREALGFWIAGVRELFEEVGVLLAVHENGGRMDPSRKAGLIDKHAALLGNHLSFQSFLDCEGLLCDLSSMYYFSSWQTPSDSAMRFNTRFFLATLPEEQSPLPASPEVVHSVWLTPDRALHLFAKDELPIIFPTFVSLRMLADFETLDSVLREFQDGKI